MNRTPTQQTAAYMAPSITHHGDVVAETRGTCSCTTEQQGFQSYDPPLWWF